MKRLSLLFLSCILLSASCHKKGSTPANPAPTNLTLNAVVSTDNSGNVSFTASATNAVTYDFDYGNGIFATVPSGVVTYKYTASGTYTVNVIAKSSGGQTISKSTTVTVTVVQSLVWSDEFDIPGAPDPAKWGYDLGAGGWGNNESQYYTNRLENASISNGTLKITAKAESFSGSNYTSARLLSKGKFSVKYGKIEFRAKLPAGGGTWPALWMLGDNLSSVGWPACGEIDVMEHLGNQLNKIYSTIHYPGHSGGSGVSANTMITNATTEFHIYTLEWTETQLKFSVDGTPFFTTANNTATMPFNQNFFLIMNVAMGGNFGGAIDPAFTSGVMEVDYVRVYQ